MDRETRRAAAGRVGLPAAERPDARRPPRRPASGSARGSPAGGNGRSSGSDMGVGDDMSFDSSRGTVGRSAARDWPRTARSTTIGEHACAPVSARSWRRCRAPRRRLDFADARRVDPPRSRRRRRRARRSVTPSAARAAARRERRRDAGPRVHPPAAPAPRSRRCPLERDSAPAPPAHPPSPTPPRRHDRRARADHPELRSRDRDAAARRSPTRDASVAQLADFADERRRLFDELAAARGETARYRQLVVDLENDAPPPFFGAGAPDDLKLIVGVGPVLERMLQQLGVTTYRQIARWTERDIDEFDAKLHEFPGRIRRDAWVTQARALHQSKYGEALPPREAGDARSAQRAGAAARRAPAHGEQAAARRRAAHAEHITAAALIPVAVLTLVWGCNWPVLKMGVAEIAPLTFRALTLPFAALGSARRREALRRFDPDSAPALGQGRAARAVQHHRLERPPAVRRAAVAGGTQRDPRLHDAGLERAVLARAAARAAVGRKVVGMVLGMLGMALLLRRRHPPLRAHADARRC